MLKLTLIGTHVSPPPCSGDASDATDSETDSWKSDESDQSSEFNGNRSKEELTRENTEIDQTWQSMTCTSLYCFGDLKKSNS